MLKLLSLIILFTSCSVITPIINEDDDYQDTPVKNTKVIKDTDNKLVENNQKTIIPKVYPTKTTENTEAVKAHCKKTDDYFKKYNWGKSHCDEFTWHHVRNSYWGNPITWFVFGDEDEEEHKNITLIMCGVHGDEITPVKFCYDLLNDLRNNPQIIGDNLIIIAPLVTPDSFFRKKPTRYNARGVDINRNFPTKDWAKNAIHLWKTRYHSDKRRYPGKYALSEQETIFSVNIINLYKPQKIISVHAPLTLLDYDGPSFAQNEGKAAKQLLVQMSNKAGKYKISNYPFFTGSLGNWAGNERNIPTYTLELPNSDWNKTDQYYKMFRTALHHAIQDNLSMNVKKSSKFTSMK
jgi:protein MpaA